MNRRLPVVSGKEAAQALERLGFERMPLKRGKGSHILMWSKDMGRPITIPNHKELDRGTLRSILRHSNISVAEFLEALGR